jgi:GNAT superfamily N-acetyltransferase
MEDIFYKTLFHHGGTALINELVVIQAIHGRGIGQALVAKARDEALARGMDEIEVSTEYENLPARSLYKKCGFEQEYVLLGLEFKI